MDTEHQKDEPTPERVLWVDGRYGSRALRYSVLGAPLPGEQSAKRKHWLTLLGVLALVVAAACVAEALGDWLLYLAGRLPVAP